MPTNGNDSIAWNPGQGSITIDGLGDSFDSNVYQPYQGSVGPTNGDMLRGVTYRKSGATTRSLVMRSKSGTVRMIESHHQLTKLEEYSVVDYS